VRFGASCLPDLIPASAGKSSENRVCLCDSGLSGHTGKMSRHIVALPIPALGTGEDMKEKLWKIVCLFVLSFVFINEVGSVLGV